MQFYQREAHLFNHIVDLIRKLTPLSDIEIKKLLSVNSLRPLKLNNSLIRKHKISDSYIDGVIADVIDNKDFKERVLLSSKDILNSLKDTLLTLQSQRNSGHENSHVAYMLNTYKSTITGVGGMQSPYPEIIQYDQLTGNAVTVISTKTNIEQVDAFQENHALKSLFYMHARHDNFTLNENTSLYYYACISELFTSDYFDKFGKINATLSVLSKHNTSLTHSPMAFPEELVFYFRQDDKIVTLVYTPVAFYRDQIINTLPYVHDDIHAPFNALTYLLGVSGLALMIDESVDGTKDFIWECYEEALILDDHFECKPLVEVLPLVGLSHQKVLNDGYPNLPLSASKPQVMQFFELSQDPLISFLIEKLDKHYSLISMEILPDDIDDVHRLLFMPEKPMESLYVQRVDRLLVSGDAAISKCILGFEINKKNTRKSFFDLLDKGKNINLTHQEYNQRGIPFETVACEYDLLQCSFDDEDITSWHLFDRLYLSNIEREVVDYWKKLSNQEKASVLLKEKSFKISKQSDVSLSSTKFKGIYKLNNKGFYLKIELTDLFCLIDDNIFEELSYINSKKKLAVEDKIRCMALLMENYSKAIEQGFYRYFEVNEHGGDILNTPKKRTSLRPLQEVIVDEFN